MISFNGKLLSVLIVCSSSVIFDGFAPAKLSMHVKKQHILRAYAGNFC
nr:MAG TPA: hypothetical protein [Caudoviricetes sp.]